MSAWDSAKVGLSEGGGWVKTGSFESAALLCKSSGLDVVIDGLENGISTAHTNKVFCHPRKVLCIFGQNKVGPTEPRGGPTNISTHDK